MQRREKQIRVEKKRRRGLASGQRREEKSLADGARLCANTQQPAGERALVSSSHIRSFRLGQLASRQIRKTAQTESGGQGVRVIRNCIVLHFSGSVVMRQIAKSGFRPNHFLFLRGILKAEEKGCGVL